MSADPRDSQPQGWIHEEEYREEVRQLIVQEEMSDLDGVVSFETWIKPTALEGTPCKPSPNRSKTCFLGI